MENTFHVQWHITDFCNLRCRHCYQSEFNPGRELSLEENEKIFKNISLFVKKEKKKLVIDITGGEPFLYGKWKELVSLVSSSETVEASGIITNGFFLTPETIACLETLKNFTLKISAEGFTREVYEYFRGPCTYRKFLDSCEALRDSAIQKTLMFTSFPGNMEEVEEIFVFMEEYGFKRAVVERFIPWGRGAAIRGEVLSRAEWKELLKKLCSGCGIDSEDLSPLAPYRGFMVEKEGQGFNLFGAPCIVARDGLAVMPEGTVFPCRRFPLAIGSLQEESLENIWRESKVLQSLKKRFLLKGKCKVCIIDNCFGCRALAYSLTGDFMAEDPLCIME